MDGEYTQYIVQDKSLANITKSPNIHQILQFNYHYRIVQNFDGWGGILMDLTLS